MRGERASPPPIPDGWITLQQAQALLGSTSSYNFGLDYLRCIPHRKHWTGKSGRQPSIFRREHIERIAQVQRGAGISMRAAVRVVMAELKGEL